MKENEVEKKTTSFQTGSLVLGIDLTDCTTRVSVKSLLDVEIQDIAFEEANGAHQIQTAIGKNKEGQNWVIGREAFELALTGKGTVVDRLLQRALEEEYWQDEKETYACKELLQIFLKLLLESALKPYEKQIPDCIVFGLETVDLEVIEVLTACIDNLGIRREQVLFVNRAECFLYQMLSQKKDFWSNGSILIDWSEHSLHYYKMTVSRGLRKNLVQVTHEILHNEMQIEDLMEERNLRLADTILSDCMKEKVTDETVSSVVMSGNGIEKCYEHGMCRFVNAALGGRRKVFLESAVFARGAVVIGIDSMLKQTAYPYTIRCEGRINADLVMEVSSQGESQRVKLVREGMCWHEAGRSVRLILDGKNQIEIFTERTDGIEPQRFEIPLTEFPSRPARTTRVELVLRFLSANEFMVRVVDLGFGELFAGSKKVIVRQFVLHTENK